MSIEPRRQHSKFTEVSVIIVTRNRPQQVLQCLKALAQSSFLSFEVVIIDQGERAHLVHPPQELIEKFARISLYHLPTKGKSRGLNYALEVASSPIVAFTDDDCIPDKDWLTQIVRSFDTNPSVMGVTGKVLPYRPELHPKEFCPSTFENYQSEPHLITHPQRHWQHIGFGNNMAFRREVFADIGKFRQVLGPGAIGQAAEDADMLLRAVLRGKALFYNPEAVIFHNRWLSDFAEKLLYRSYIRGEVACYGYLALQGQTFAQQVIRNNMHQIKNDGLRAYWQFRKLKTDFFSLAAWTVLRGYSFVIGCCIALGIFWYEKIRYGTRFQKASPFPSAGQTSAPFQGISVIIPTQGDKRSLTYLLHQLQSQIYQPDKYEVIVVNNNPDDGGLKEFLDKTAVSWPNVKYCDEIQKGPSWARNKGVAVARFKHLIFIDDDVTVSPLFLQGYEDAWRKYPYARIIGGKTVAQLNEPLPLTSRQQKLLRQYPWCFGQLDLGSRDICLGLGSLLYSGNMSYRLENPGEQVFHPLLGVFSLGIGRIGAEDFELTTRSLLKHEAVIYCADPRLIVTEEISAVRYTKSYLAKRHFLGGIEVALLERYLKKQFPHFKSLYLKRCQTIGGMRRILFDHYERIMFISFLFNGQFLDVAT